MIAGGLGDKEQNIREIERERGGIMVSGARWTAGWSVTGGHDAKGASLDSLVLSLDAWLSGQGRAVQDSAAAG